MRPLLETKFVNNTLSLTDLNKDSVAEIWVMYRISYPEEVSPSTMKVIMYERRKKFAMKGGSAETYGGEYLFDKAFTDTPVELRVFARKLWANNIMQVYD